MTQFKAEELITFHNRNWDVYFCTSTGYMSTLVWKQSKLKWHWGTVSAVGLPLHCTCTPVCLIPEVQEAEPLWGIAAFMELQKQLPRVICAPL